MDVTGEAPRGTAVVPAQQLAERFAALRSAWLDIAADLATVGPVNELLMTRLHALEALGVASENDLLSIAEDAAQVALQVTTAEGARTLSKRLRRAVYEYLLAVDATAAAAAFLDAPPVAVVAQPAARPGSMMIGLEEVAQAEPPPAPDGSEVGSDLEASAGAAADPGPEPDDQVLAHGVVLTIPAGIEAGNGAVHHVEPGEGLEDEDPGGVALDDTGALGAPGTEAEPAEIPPHAGADAWDEDPGSAGAPPQPSPAVEAVAAPEAAPEAVAGGALDSRLDADHGEPGGDTEAADPAASRPQFTVIGPEDVPVSSEPAAVPAPPQAVSEPEVQQAPPRFRRESPPPPAAVVVPSYRAWADVIAAAAEAEPAPPLPQEQEEEPDDQAPDVTPADTEAPIAVLGDPDTPLLVEVPIIDPRSLEPAPAGEPPEPDGHDWPDVTSEYPADAGAESGGWSVRKSPRQQLLSARMAEKRRAQAVRAAEEAIAEVDKGRRRRERDPEPLNPGAVPLQVDELIHRKKGADAAALLQRAAQELGGPELAELALGAGDRVRELGQTKPAINCYLAGWRADPLNEAPLWRLAETCLNDHSVEQGVGYLQRIADLMRARGDDEGAIAVYRRIVTVAPDNKEVRELLRHVHATGRLLD